MRLGTEGPATPARLKRLLSEQCEVPRSFTSTPP